MTILVTGSRGLIGRRLVPLLRSEQHRVIELVRPTGTRHPSTSSRTTEFIELDLSTDWNTLALPRRVDTVYHLAQSPNFRDFPGSAMDIFNVNVGSTLKLLDYAVKSGATRFVYASSGGIYQNSSGPMAEDGPLSPPRRLGFYLATKLSSEALVEQFYSQLHVVILRPFFVYGSGQRRDMLIPRIVDRVASGEPITLAGRDGIRINPIHVNDAAAAFRAAVHLDRSVKVNVAGPEALSLREIALLAGRATGKEPQFASDPGAVPKDVIGQTDRMRSLLHKPAIALSQGIHDVFA